MADTRVVTSVGDGDGYLNLPILSSLDLILVFDGDGFADTRVFLLVRLVLSTRADQLC